jgi:hypothetical protein
LLLASLAACDPHPTNPEPVDDSSPVALDEGTTAALVRSEWPSPQDPGPPFYARIESTPPHLLVADGVAVIFFYREPGCIPASFNLLEFFHPPIAFGCVLTVDGFAEWEDGIGSGAPKMSISRGSDVPVWIVPATTALSAVDDGMLTIAELSALPGLVKGRATRFHEMLQPSAFMGQGGHPIPSLVIEAKGQLDAGGVFRFHYTRNDGIVHAAKLRMR